MNDDLMNKIINNEELLPEDILQVNKQKEKNETGSIFSQGIEYFSKKKVDERRFVCDEKPILPKKTQD